MFSGKRPRRAITTPTEIDFRKIIIWRFGPDKVDLLACRSETNVRQFSTRVTASPIRREVQKVSESGNKPASLYLPIAASPAEAMHHPHSEQTRSPLN